MYLHFFDFSELQLNRLICDCNLKWMINWMSKMKSRGKNVNVQGKCDHPYAVKDKRVNDLRKNQMVCGKNHFDFCGSRKY